MNVFRDAASMRAWALERGRQGRSIGLVPTMGALHEGHASLMRAAVAQNDDAVVSIFVNPTQFAPHEDYDSYPRSWEADCALARDVGIRAIYAPLATTMYPPDYATYVDVERLTDGLCGRSRPQLFRGVTTVVTKLFNAVQPNRAYFGRKDAQQVAVVRRMARDLDFGVEIVEMPIVREPDGLALSSRNAYLSPDERVRALCLNRALQAGKALIDAGERDAEAIVEEVRRRLDAVDRIDYADLVDAEEMTGIEEARGSVLLAVAAWVGHTRLIDNIQCEVPVP